VPVLYLTGNQTRARLGTGLGVRQFGFQSMPFVELMRTITKYAVIVMDEQDILFELEKALWYAKEGRMGPVVVDIPDDIQRAEVNPAALHHFIPPYSRTPKAVGGLYQAKRPLIALGWGVHLAGGRQLARDMITKLGVPCVTTWGAADIMAGHPLYIGTWGTHGVRAANFAIQNADLVIAIGTRLDTKATGSPASSFAPRARLVMVDIDKNELAKMEKIGRPCLTVHSDALSYMEFLKIEGDFSQWIAKIDGWKRDYPAILPEYGPENPYRFMQELGKYLTVDDLVVSDTGCPLAWAMQTIPFKGRFIHAFNQTPMGYGLPASIGCAGAHPGRVILLTGDGGLSENITEFATIAKHNLNIKTILFNNRGHAMCRQTQKQWLGGVYHGTSAKDLATPEFMMVARAYRIGIALNLHDLMSMDRPAFLEVNIDEEQGVIPQVRFGKSIEDADPALPEDVLEKIMETDNA
jgi:acetolactate synthase-1/2/3 large subunit